MRFLLVILVSLSGCRTVHDQSDLEAMSLSCPVEPSGSDCQLYSCVESEASCGDDGYPAGFGKRYCERFMSFCDGGLFTENEKKWVAATGKCLQRSTLEAQVLSDDCEVLAEKSFSAHSRCYTSGAKALGAKSICSLGPLSWNRIRSCIDLGDQLSRQGLVEIAKTIRSCAGSLLGSLFLDGQEGSVEIPDETLRREWAAEATKLSSLWLKEAGEL